LRAADPTGKGGAVFHVTVLRARGGRLVKLFTADGRKLGTEKAARFCYEPLECRGARDFFAKMSGLERHRDRCVIRAAPGRWFPDDGKPVFRLSDAQPAYMDNAGAGPRVLPGKVKQAGREPEIDDTLLRAIMLPMFEEEPTWWVLLDFEGVDHEPDWRRRLADTAGWLKLRLPDEFADVSCWYQATGGAANPFRPDLGGCEVRMRLGFVLSRPLTHD
jgi:hypothetical protein